MRVLQSRYPLVFIVILNYNGVRFLKRFLPILLQTSYPNYKIIVGDNHSNDDSVSFLSAEYPDIIQVHNDRNYGFSEGYNQIFHQINQWKIKPKYYVLLNSDVAITPAWLIPLVEILEKEAKTAAVQPKILSYNNPKFFEYAGACGGYMDLFFYPFCRGRIFIHCEEDEGQYEDSLPVFWVSGAAFVIRANLFHKLGGFNPYYFAHHEEIDLCWRLQNTGYILKVVPQSVVYHVGGGTLPYNSSRKVYYNHSNNLIMIVNNLPFRAYWWRILFRIFFEQLVFGSYNLLMLKWQLFISVLKAHWRFIYWYFMLKKKQNPLYKSKQYNAPLQGYYNRFVILQFYLLRRKAFGLLYKKREG